ncbi:BatD family protein [Flavicella sediminum]|uniref:BatD family protein n=1 Tax=Flavicella sediminum TaxID=2585141 RepID=UPI00112094D5|nr:BatD family protein [Flavicella sediminum]
MKIRSTYLLLILVTQSLFAQVEFKAKVSKNKLGLNQRLRVEFTINKQGGDNFSPPSFKNFDVVGGPSQSVNQSWINGKSSYSQSYSYIVSPIKKGALKIGSATIEFSGKIIKSNPLTVDVVDAVELPKDPNDPDYIANQNVHLEVLVSDSNPYVGEGIFVEYRLYFSHKVALSDFDFKELPEYEGFWNQDIKIDQLTVEEGKYQGEDYRFCSIRKSILIPQKSGDLVLEPIKTDLIIGVPTGRGDFFGNPITRNIRKSFRSFKKTIKVKSLPLEGKPADFVGAVGDFKLDVSTSKATLKANESTQLKVQISGRGNLKLFELPKVQTPKELEVYTPEHNENLRNSLSGIKGMRGEVVDQYTVVPAYKGKYKIPSVSFSYFNPSEKKYYTLQSDEVFVNVTEGKELVTNSDATNSNNAAGSVKQQVVAAENNFRYIQTKTSLETPETTDFFKSTLFYILLLLPVIVIPMGILIGKKQKQRANDLIGNRTRKADKLARKYLSQAKKEIGKKEAFYIALEKALLNYLKAKLQMQTSEVSKDRIAKLLTKKGVEAATITNFVSVLDNCDFARYAPATDVTMNDDFDKAKQVITKLDKQL